MDCVIKRGVLSQVPEAVQPLIDRLVTGVCAILADNLVGIYLHGSLAMGEFNPRLSDVDFLVLAYAPLDLAAKQALVSLTLDLAPDAPPKGIEYSVVLLRHTQHFLYPTPFEFHASPYWYERLKSGEVDLMAERDDPDLAAHFTITKARGVCLYGEPIADVFGDVPEAAYWSSIYGDAESILDNISADPVYGVLNLCRVLAYQRDRKITSKREGGQWGLENLDPRFHPLIRQALAASGSDAPSGFTWDNADLMAFADYAGAHLAASI